MTDARPDTDTDTVADAADADTDHHAYTDTYTQLSSTLARMNTDIDAVADADTDVDTDADADNNSYTEPPPIWVRMPTLTPIQTQPLEGERYPFWGRRSSRHHNSLRPPGAPLGCLAPAASP